MNIPKGKPHIIILSAVLILTGLSFVPWSKITNGTIKDFDLFSDIIKTKKPAIATATEPLDPQLAELSREVSKHTRSTADVQIADTLAEPPQLTPIVDGMVVIEDYTPEGLGLQRLHNAVARGNARIGVIGDSYIEGDIFTQNIRAMLQKQYGGSGVGYVPLSSQLTGFRTSVRQKCSGWTEHDMRKSKSDAQRWLAGEWCTSSAGANTSYNGTNRLNNLDKWSNSRILFKTASDGNITVTTDAGTTTYPVTASPNVQSINVTGNTSMAEFSTDITGLKALGAWLDGNGVSVDCMSLRGNSGISHRQLDSTLVSQMRKYVDYQCIIVEYGINALSSQQQDYTAYGKAMSHVIRNIKALYPQADIIMLGIGDRGQRVDGEVASLPTSQAMVDTQRKVARENRIMFWDTRTAMGGKNAVIDWRNRGLINADYIHLNSKGGAALAELFVKALNKSMNQ